jgi:hypothetical protein
VKVAKGVSPDPGGPSSIVVTHCAPSLSASRIVSTTPNVNANVEPLLFNEPSVSGF